MKISKVIALYKITSGDIPVVIYTYCESDFIKQNSFFPNILIWFDLKTIIWSTLFTIWSDCEIYSSNRCQIHQIIPMKRADKIVISDFPYCPTWHRTQTWPICNFDLNAEATDAKDEKGEHRFAIWVQMTILAILTNDQLVTNMVNMGAHQNHSKKLVHWSKLELICWCLWPFSDFAFLWHKQ